LPVLMYFCLAAPSPAIGLCKEGIPSCLHIRRLSLKSDMLAVSSGAFDVFHEGEALGTGRPRPEVRIEYRMGLDLFWVGPLLGISVNTDGGVLGYAGGYIDWSLGQWIVSTAGGVGGYRTARSKDLDGILQFVAEGTVAREIGRGIRLGLTFAHSSNGYTRDRNPGVESLLVTLAFRIRQEGSSD
jgi:lipid A 3-O-deacylase